MARRPLCSLILLLGLSLLSSTRADDKPCTGHYAGKYYDLNRLQAGKDYELKTPGGNELVLSACKSVSHETWGLKVQDPGLVGGFVRRGHGDFSMGQTNTTLSFSGRANHPHLTLASGSKCLDANGKTIEHLQGSAEIEFICDTSAGAGSPRLVAQLPPGGEDAVCAWFFEWRTAAACPTSEGTTFGGVVWFIFVSLLIFLLLYLAIGTAYNYSILHLAGTDAIPRFTLAGMLYHGREAWEMAGDWWASGRGGRSFTPSARGPVGLGGPGGFRRAAGGPEREAFMGGENGSAGPNAFIRTSVRKEQPQPQTNPASHQTQVMGPPSNSMPAPGFTPMPAPMGGLNPASHQAQVMTPPAHSMPSPTFNSAAAQMGGMNPASHQAQLMAGMPVPQLEQGQNQAQNPHYAAPTPTRQTFAVGDDDGDGDGDDDAPEIQVADVRGRVGGAAGGGDIRL